MSGGTQGSGGAQATGGSLAGTANATGGTTPATSVVTGGTPATGGARTGGSPGQGTGGSMATATGGTKSTGGSVAVAGTVVTGGSRASGGTQATGGASVTGGAPTTGGSKATGGTTATGGATSTSACGVVPVTPNASQQTKNVLCYLYSQYGNHVLSGQQEANWNDNPTNVSWYAANGMKTPAILGSDFAYHSNSGCTGVNISTTHAIAHWNAGGLVMYRYHMGMPVGGTTCANDCYDGTNCSMSTPPSGFFTALVTAGTPENAALNARFDYMTVQIKAMAAAGMPVILALFHETQSNGWFWWSKTSAGSDFIKLYTYAFNYLTTTKGNTNIIWLMPWSGTPSAAFYPGKALVDIAGGDTYGTNPPFASLYTSVRNIVGTTMPIPLHETGTVPQPNTMFPNTAPWILWSVWAGYETSANSLANMQAAYSSPYTITRDEVPNLK